MRAGFADILIWLRGTANEAFTRLLPHRPAGPVLRLAADGWRCGDNDAASPDDLPSLTRSLRRKGARDVTLRFAEGRFVARQLTTLSLPDSRHAAMAALDLSAATPFGPDEALALPVAAPGFGSGYAIVRQSGRSFLNPSTPLTPLRGWLRR